MTKAMAQAIRAGLFYFLIVFVIAFGLGVFRVGFVIPRVGTLGAVLLEVPVLLALSWVVCRAIVRRAAVPPTLSARIAMGVTAFTLLMLAELALSVLLIGRTPAAHLALYRDLPEQIGLAAQLGFAAIPLLQRYGST